MVVDVFGERGPTIKGVHAQFTRGPPEAVLLLAATASGTGTARNYAAAAVKHKHTVQPRVPQAASAVPCSGKLCAACSNS
jgi:hypothetical protein